MTEEVINEQENEEVAADEAETESNSEAENNLETDNDESSESSTEEETVDNSESDGGESDEVQDPDGQLPEWTKKRLQRERRKRERVENELATLKAQSSQLVNAIQQQAKGQNGAQFDANIHVADPVTGEVFFRDSVEGQVIETLQKREKLKEQREAQQRAQSEAAQLKAKFEKGYDKYDDYQELIESMPFSKEMLDAVAISDNPDDFVYSLGKDRFADVERISKLPPKQQYKEMVKLELEFEQSKGKKIVKQAPKPPATVKGDSHIEKDPDKMSYEELRARARAAEEAKYGVR